MIHQIIFAHARPDWSEQRFQEYWRDVHAVRYASRIPQIRLYKVCLRVPMEDLPIPQFGPPFHGTAEIWVDDLEQQLASLRSPEFIDGARADEPNWAAFWNTVFLATDTHVIRDAPEDAIPPDSVKLYVTLKRREGVPLPCFREYLLKVQSEKAANLPGLLRLQQCVVLDAMYGFGETTLDAVSLFTFESEASLESALRSEIFGADVLPDFASFAEPRYLRALAVRENWIIGPEPR